MFWRAQNNSSRAGISLMARSLASDSAYAPVVLIFFLSTSLISSFLIDILVAGGREGALLTSVLSLIAPLTFLYFYKYLHEVVQSFSRRVISTLFAYSFATFIRGLTTFELSSVVVQPERPLFDQLLPLGIPLFMALLMGSVVSYRQAIHLQLVARLMAERDRLVRISQEFESTLVESREELVNQIHSELRPAIEAIKVELNTVEHDPDIRATVAVDALSSLVSDVVRPLSHELARSTEFSEVADKPVDRQTKVNRILRTRVKVTHLMNMRFVAQVEIFETLVLGPLMRVESSSVLGDLVNTACTYVVARYLVRITPRRWRSQRTSKAVLIWIGYFVISLVAVRSATSLIMPSVFGNEFFAAHLAFRFVFVLGFVGIGVIKQLDDTADAELRSTVEKLEQLVSRLRREVATQRKDLSWVLHGPVQSALISTAVELNLSRNTGTPLIGFAERMEEVVSSIGANHPRNPNLEVLLSEMKDVWGHSISFETHISSQAHDQLRHDFSLATCVVEFVREGVANAFRHAKARNVSIHAFVSSEGMFVVQVTNDGKPLDPGRTEGLGSSIFDEVCWRWSLDSLEDSSTRLSGHMPCATLARSPN